MTVTISMTGRSCAVGLRARKIICPAVSRNISTSEYSPGDGTKAWRTFARMSAFKCTASVRFKAWVPVNQRVVTEADPALDSLSTGIAGCARNMDAGVRLSGICAVLRFICARK